MSRTSDIQCKQCGHGLWIGQSEHIYTSESVMKALGVFLQVHRGHPLVFDYDDAVDVPGDYRSLHDSDVLSPSTSLKDMTSEEVAVYTTAVRELCE